MAKLLWTWGAPAIGPAPDSYNLYRGLASGAETLYQTGITNTQFLDAGASPGTTYWGYVKAVAAGIESPPSNEVTITVGQQGMYLFSTGTLYADAGAGPVEFALVQDVAVMIAGQRRLLYDAPQVSAHPVDVGLFGREAYMQAVNASFSAAALQMLLGSTQSGSNPVVETLGRTVTLPMFSAVLTTQSTGGLQQIYTFGNVRAPGVVLPAKLEDFTLPQFAMHGYPDSGGVLATVQMQF
ncbi:hypothetical protein CCAX7_000280 [Capsulimonas corticalis]|uniref:Uncharacterized protein n=1 Tax=Capsulimonas corticalis TaxID=2219043 RepID=A0A402CRF4_9BACT|nr:fibronectin type III domain-containing protein [Capsulimonas corticalis]BDI27977.1 hypothetical protein CCAX7_000280 [Capsulimonas corticalis]